MSYKNKQQKKNRFNQLKRSIGLIRIALWKKIKIASDAIKNLLPNKEADMIQKVKLLMQKLRQIAAGVSEKNKKIDAWIDGYIKDCVVFRKPIVFLTQVCISRDLEVRRENQGGRFEPTEAERELVFVEIPRLLKVFKDLGLPLAWWFTFNRSYLDSGRLNPLVESEYKEMFRLLFERAGILEGVMILDWEDEVLLARPVPAQLSDKEFRELIPDAAFEIELRRHSDWARNEAGLAQTDEELLQDARFQIGCEIEEGRLLTSETSPLGQEGKFVLVPLETAERYVFFEKLSPSFSKRIAALLSPYPWRMAN